ncbi:hypothetical protein EPO05_03540 [Patescibacteria group bacterium]|nr:MAG: hypothetical protein EPO05_03540 [Patescibacteria group bacterium]
MASQIAHIVYAKKYIEAIVNGTLPDGMEDKVPAHFQHDEFFLGCVFPDIRRIDSSVARRETHMILENLNLDFAYLDSFHAGWKFHLYCDMKREEILGRYNFYAIERASDFWNNPAKRLEDELIYNEYNNWEKIASYFNDPPVVETGINVSRETFELWYAILARYISQKPNSQTISVFLSKQPSVASKAKDIIKVVDKLRQNDKVVEILKKVKDEIIGI